MKSIADPSVTAEPAEPKCPVFGECGGCKYQDIGYDSELQIKQRQVEELLRSDFPGAHMESICPSPRPYYYRNRLDLSLIRTKDKVVHIGFKPAGRFRTLEIDSCPIAQQPINDFLPRLKSEAEQKLTEKYRIASLVVKTGDGGEVRWGGIGRRSLRLEPEHYLWTAVGKYRVYYSLDSFFQANTSILPDLRSTLLQWHKWSSDKDVFLDLYGGVGLFSMMLADHINAGLLIEENIHATRIAEYNLKEAGLSGIKVVTGRVEDHQDAIAEASKSRRLIGMIDPPRKGMTEDALNIVSEISGMNMMFYLSCNPEAFARDAAALKEKGWVLQRVRPFDFFPKTEHIEVLALFGRSDEK